MSLLVRVDFAETCGALVNVNTVDNSALGSRLCENAVNDMILL
jgi:hypothetical protein